jgi:hypothetical protein
MRRYAIFSLIVSCIPAILLGSFNAPPLLAADTVSQFSVIAPGDPLQAELQIVRRAGWGNLGLAAAPAPSTPVAMTRYEMALETAKSLIAVRARQNADSNWHRTVSPQALRALRALCAGLQSELTGFEVNVPATLNFLDTLLADAGKLDDTQTGGAPQVGSTPNPRSVLNLQAGRDDFAKGSNGGSLVQSLSQKLRVYSALDSLARQERDPLTAREYGPTAFSFRRDNATNDMQRLRAGATFEVNPGLQLHADVTSQTAENNTARVPSLRDFLSGTSAESLGAPFSQSAGSVGAGLDLKVLPGVVFSSDVARVSSSSHTGDALRYDGGLELSGWQNRVALSAHLSRLVPEDALALGATAARLNLGVGLTSQIQLKLMYQQMFGANAALQGAPRFGGGLDFSF